TASDDEMRARIARHQASRPEKWHTLEEPLDLAAVVRQAYTLTDVLLLDCVTLWLGNVMLQEEVLREGESEEMGNEDQGITNSLFDERSLRMIDELLEVIQSAGANKTLIVVSNEVGLGIVPANALGRVYRDTLGFVNQRLAQVADRVYLMVAGLAVDIKRLHEEASLGG
ncbi:MAG TPA: bifunctional adenosylcobinamide kinase/adenosylcobinamide-phosphate guanylyltransferase, partial [Ktedonobacteraceae bacterium]|nr:bifunctional adenosylcobinamide kinase/adenosylcobinamide-phosphate guanylyltransferase [Ktedonobacteraceae bacterium]